MNMIIVKKTIARAPQDMLSQGAMMGATMASQFLDPIISCWFIPFICQANEARIIDSWKALVDLQ